MEKKRSGPGWVVFAVLSMLLAGVPVAHGAAPRAVIKVAKKAASDGEVRFTFTSQGGQPTDITVKVLEKMKPHEIAGDIKKEIALALGDAWNIRVNEENNVVIEPADKKTEFTVKLAGQTAAGLSVAIK